jgi:hypothetical protein
MSNGVDIICITARYVVIHRFDNFMTSPFPTDEIPFASFAKKLHSSSPPSTTVSISPQPNHTTADRPLRVMVPTIPNPVSTGLPFPIFDEFVSARTVGRNEEEDGRGTQNGMTLT